MEDEITCDLSEIFLSDDERERFVISYYHIWNNDKTIM